MDGRKIDLIIYYPTSDNCGKSKKNTSVKYIPIDDFDKRYYKNICVHVPVGYKPPRKLLIDLYYGFLYKE